MHAKFKTLDATARQSNAPKSKLSKQSKTHHFYTPNPMRVSSLFVSHCISIPYPASYEETFQTEQVQMNKLPKDDNALDDPASRASTELGRRKLDRPLSSLKCMNEQLLLLANRTGCTPAFRRKVDRTWRRCRRRIVVLAVSADEGIWAVGARVEGIREVESNVLTH